MSNQGWIEAIGEMLRDELKIADTVLFEDDGASECRPIKIRKPGKSLFVSLNAKVAFKTNAAPTCIKDRLFPLFREHPGVTRICDYLILSERNSQGGSTLYVLLCELKSGRPGDIAQLENAKLLAEYVVRMVGHHRKLPFDRVEYRGLIFSPKAKAPKAGLRAGGIGYMPRGRLSLRVVFLPDDASYSLPSLYGS